MAYRYASQNAAQGPPAMPELPFMNNLGCDVPYPREVFAASQCAGYTIENYAATVARHHNMTIAYVEEAYNTAYGSVANFLELARVEKVRTDIFLNDSNSFILGTGPKRNTRVEYAYMEPWNFYVRLYGFEDLGPRGGMAFDFVDAEYRHMDAPPDMTINAGTNNGIPIHPMQYCLRRAFSGPTAHAFQIAGSDLIGEEVYVITQGVVVHINYRGHTRNFEIPFVRAPANRNSVPFRPRE